VVEDDDGEAQVVRETFELKAAPLGPDTVGLGLAKAKELLATVQETVVDEQVKAALAEQEACPGCGARHRHKDARTIVLRTLFGTLRLRSPRWHRCRCTPTTDRTFSALAALLPERTPPELAYLETKFAGLVSYGLSARLLGEVLPLGRRLHATELRRRTHAVAGRLDAELGPEPGSSMVVGPSAQDLPRPDLPLVVGLDGGFVHSAHQRSRRDGWFEVIAGKAVPAEGKARCFGFVQTYDAKPKRRLYELLRTQGMAPNQQVTFLTDGGDDVRELPLYLNPGSEHLLDWFHLTMRLTVLAQMAKGLPPPASRGEDGHTEDDEGEEDLVDVAHELERVKRFLWHGNVYRALETIGWLGDAVWREHPEPERAKLTKALAVLERYISANRCSIPSYAERHLAGERISTGFIESTVNQVISKRMVKQQAMRWTPKGAHLLVQVRTRVLNDDLADDFRRWYPGFAYQPEGGELAA
jgi:hypothetical protein